MTFAVFPNSASTELEMRTNRTKKTLATVVDDSPGLEDRVRQCAYELYEARGREDGHDVEDWINAESEIRQTKFRTTTA